MVVPGIILVCGRPELPHGSKPVHSVLLPFGSRRKDFRKGRVFAHEIRNYNKTQTPELSTFYASTGKTILLLLLLRSSANALREKNS